jgi:uncharacterized membrane protein YdbT with pleckstrin-like domain
MNKLVVRPLVRKTFVKGLIAISMMSALLQVNVSNFAHYLIFLAVSLSLVLAYMAVKHSYIYMIDEDGVIINSIFARKSIRYDTIIDMYVSQGAIARRFHCGTVYIITKDRGSNPILANTRAETLKDVTDPEKIYEAIAAMLGHTNLASLSK